MMLENTAKQKMVKINTVGPIMPLGGIYGPTIPRVMDTKTISLLIQKGYEVYEVLSNKKEVRLNLMNYNKDLNGGKNEEYIKSVPKPVNKIETFDPNKRDKLDELKKMKKETPKKENLPKKEDLIKDKKNQEPMQQIPES